MKLLEIGILIIMAVGFAAGGFLLWNRRNETNDYSRHMQAMLNWMSSFLSLVFLFRLWFGNPSTDNEILEAELIFFPSLIRLLFLVYPIEVIKHGMSRMKIYPLVFFPAVALLIVGMFSGLTYTELTSVQDIIRNIGKFDVLFRVFSMVLLFLYCFILFLIPNNLRRCGTDRSFIPRFALLFCLLGVTYSVTLVTNWACVGFLHQIIWMMLFFSVTYWELKKRMISNLPEDSSQISSKTQTRRPASGIESAQADELWEKILHVIEDLEGWRNPEISLNSLSEQVLSNRTYVGEAFKRNTGMTFTEYINKRRIDSVVEVLTRNPKSHIQDVFLDAGYRQRSTAWKNFHKFMGVSPTEFIENLV